MIKFFYLLTAVLFTGLLSGCNSKSKRNFTVEHNYSYIIEASITGGLENTTTHFELRRKSWRRTKFLYLPEEPNTAMYAYRLTNRYGYNEKLQKNEFISGDTIEIAVTKPQADNIFRLAKAVFESVIVSNIDTVYTEPKMTAFQTDDVSGSVCIKSSGGNIRIITAPLHSPNNRQAAPFLSFYKGFESLFPKGK